MCGLCGVYGFVAQQEKKVFTHLQLFSQLRGRDSTGVAIVDRKKNNEVTVVKSVGGLETLVDEFPAVFHQRDWTINEYNLLALVGHHRHATVGDIDEDNAHPFEFDNIVGCHNGTVQKYHMSGMEAYDATHNDSRIILGQIDKSNHPEEVISKIDGAWALTWFDKRYSSMNMLRNADRTLFVAITSDGTTLFWASESWMLNIAMDRAGMKWDRKVQPISVDTHVVWGIKKGKVVIVDSSKVEGKKIPAYLADPYAGYGSSFYTPSKQQVLPPPAKKDKHDKLVDLVQARKALRGGKLHTQEETFEEDYVFVFDNEFVSRKDYESMVECGCQYCDGVLTWADRKTVWWFDSKTPVCKACGEKEFSESTKEVTVH